MEDKNVEKCWISEIPLPLIKSFCLTFFDLDSIINFSSTNKKHRDLLSEFRRAHYHLNQSGFIKKYQVNDKSITKKEFFREILNRKNKYLIF